MNSRKGSIKAPYTPYEHKTYTDENRREYAIKIYQQSDSNEFRDMLDSIGYTAMTKSAHEHKYDLFWDAVRKFLKGLTKVEQAVYSITINKELL